jgi:two-component system, response regulator
MEKATILLVEDNPDDVELTLHAFTKHNLINQVVVARDGREALDYMFATGSHAGRDATDLPDLILLDLKLPKIGGIEVLRELRAAAITKHVPVVILTTSDDESDIADGYDLGINSYIRKPVDFDKFIQTVKDVGMYWLVLNTPPPK